MFHYAVSADDIVCYGGLGLRFESALLKVLGLLCALLVAPSHQDGDMCELVCQTSTLRSLHCGILQQVMAHALNRTLG